MPSAQSARLIFGGLRQHGAQPVPAVAQHRAMTCTPVPVSFWAAA